MNNSIAWLGTQLASRRLWSRVPIALAAVALAVLGFVLAIKLGTGTTHHEASGNGIVWGRRT